MSEANRQAQLGSVDVRRSTPPPGVRGAGPHSLPISNPGQRPSLDDEGGWHTLPETFRDFLHDGTWLHDGTREHHAGRP